MSEYLTRLTPNFNSWKKPSGREGKACNQNSPNRLYECANGFGWEEWLFNDYHINLNDKEALCFGFIQAFNRRREDLKHIKKLHLYTLVGENNQGIKEGPHYIGYINNVSRVEYQRRSFDEVSNDLADVDLSISENDPMVDFAINISFKVKDVKVDFKSVFNGEQRTLRPGQYRFAIYPLDQHQELYDFVNS